MSPRSSWNTHRNLTISFSSSNVRVKIVWKSGNLACTVHATFLSLHPHVLYFIYTLIRMQKFCHQKLNLPSKSGVPQLHYLIQIFCYTALHCCQAVYKQAHPLWFHVVLHLKSEQKKGKRTWKSETLYINPLNAELHPIWHLLALLGAHHILHVSRIRVK